MLRGAQRAVRDERARAREQAGRGLDGIDVLSPCRVEQVELIRELRAKASLIGEEELELQEVTQAQRVLGGGLDELLLGRGGFSRVPDLGQADDRELDDR